MIHKKKEDVPFMEVKNMQILKVVMEKREEAREKYWAYVYNKMKPNWLFA